MSKKTYVVTAETGFDGHEKGEEFEAELDEELEQRAIERGSIKEKGGKKNA
jgi:hypothetical protein